MRQPKLEEPFLFTTIKEWQEANKRANELGLKSLIEHLDKADGIVWGKWVKRETSSERP
jgi:hypothetical protein